MSVAEGRTLGPASGRRRGRGRLRATSIIDETLTFVGYVRYSCVTANHGYVRYLCVTTNPLSNGGSIANLTLNINYYNTISNDFAAACGDATHLSRYFIFPYRDTSYNLAKARTFGVWPLTVLGRKNQDLWRVASLSCCTRWASSVISLSLVSRLGIGTTRPTCHRMHHLIPVAR